MAAPSGFSETRGPGVLWVRDGWADVDAELCWRPTGGAVDHAKGRGGILLLQARSGGIVVRTYRRGGLLRKLLPDLYLSRSRAFAELAILHELAELGVPVVEPVFAAARRRFGLLWELRIGTRALEGGMPLPAFCAAHPELSRQAVSATGRAVAAMFDAGCLHRDLHPDNVLARVDAPAIETPSLEAPAVDVRILDFDRAVRRPELTASEREGMLLRMWRYLRKHRARLPVRVRSVDALRFLAGMGMGREERRTALAALVEGYARMARRHRVE